MSFELKVLQLDRNFIAQKISEMQSFLIIF
jgi:hypothetical protein